MAAKARPASKWRSLPDPHEQPTITVKEAALLLGISERSAYEAAHRGEIPVIRLGRRMTVPTVLVLRMIGFDGAGDRPADGSRP